MYHFLQVFDALFGRSHDAQGSSSKVLGVLLGATAGAVRVCVFACVRVRMQCIATAVSKHGDPLKLWRLHVPQAADRAFNNKQFRSALGTAARHGGGGGGLQRS